MDLGAIVVVHRAAVNTVIPPPVEAAFTVVEAEDAAEVAVEAKVAVRIWK